MGEELKPCPFCGGKKIKKNSDDGQFWNTCQTCFADGPPTGKRSADDAPDWNTRAALKACQGEAEADSGVLSRDCVEHYHPEYGVGMFFTADALRTVYTAPPATGVIVPRELLEQWADKLDGADSAGYGWEDKLPQELRALLAQSQEVR